MGLGGRLPSCLLCTAGYRLLCFSQGNGAGFLDPLCTTYSTGFPVVLAAAAASA